MRRFNRGEWSELYAICSILHDKIIKVADSNLEPTGDIIQVMQLFMTSVLGESEYDISNTDDRILIAVDGKIRGAVKIDADSIAELLRGISSGTGRSFNIPTGDELMDHLRLENFKANSLQKSDLVARSLMPYESTPRTVGFSIKSYVGAMPTLLNASRATNFIYEVQGFTGDIDEINSIMGSCKIRTRVEAIRQHGGTLVYSGTENEIFKQNLRMVDSLLPQIMAYMLVYFYSHRGILTLKDASGKVISLLPFDCTKAEVETKIKTFLSDVTLGMIPTREWDGRELGGGCIFIKRNGDIVCFTLYDRDEFKDYLIRNTKFDTGSSSRNDFGYLYKDNQSGKLLFKLNLDIRMM